MSLFPTTNYERHSEQLLHWPRLWRSFLASLLPTSAQLSGEGGETSFHIAQVCRVECGLRLALLLHHACRWSDFKKVFKDRCSIKLAKETHLALFCNKPITSMDSRTPISFMISVSTIKFSFICHACKQLAQLVRMGFIRSESKLKI